MHITRLIDTKIIEAMKSKDQFTLDTFRMVKTSLQNASIAKADHHLSDEDEILLLQKEVKKRRDAALMYQDGGRPELADKEEREAELLSQFLPTQMSDAEIETAVKDAINQCAATSKQDMGRVMGILKPTLAGKAEPSRVSSVVLRLLN